MYKATNAGLEDKVRAAGGEIEKGNHIIQRLQADLASTRSKVKLKHAVVMQQETKINDKVGWGGVVCLAWVGWREVEWFVLLGLVGIRWLQVVGGRLQGVI